MKANMEANTELLLKVIEDIQIKARDKLREKIDKLLKSDPKKKSVKSKGPHTSKNNYDNYQWIEIRYNEKVFWLTMFWNDVDSWESLKESSGNYHTQYGRIQFWKDISFIEKIGRYTNNEIISTSETDIKLIIDKSKSADPLEYMDNFTKQDCLNGKWVTVDDVLRDDKDVCSIVAEAFTKFIKK